MSDAPTSTAQPEPSPEEVTSALFAHLVMQQSNMALMLLGKVPHPENGETMRDLEGARIFIDHLEMLESKTKGNLTKDEQALLKQTLYGLRMAFVEVVDSAETKSPPAPAKAPQPPAATEPAASASADPAAKEESHKKFSKKY